MQPWTLRLRIPDSPRRKCTTQTKSSKPVNHRIFPAIPSASWTQNYGSKTTPLALSLCPLIISAHQASDTACPRPRSQWICFAYQRHCSSTLPHVTATCYTFSNSTLSQIYFPPKALSGLSIGGRTTHLESHRWHRLGHRSCARTSGIRI